MLVRVTRSLLASLHRDKALPPGFEWLAAFDIEDIEDFASEYVTVMERSLAGLEEWDYPGRLCTNGRGTMLAPYS